MEGGYGLSKDYQAAAEHFTAAAEEAEAALKPKVRHGGSHALHVLLVISACQVAEGWQGMRWWCVGVV